MNEMCFIRKLQIVLIIIIPLFFIVGCDNPTLIATLASTPSRTATPSPTAQSPTATATVTQSPTATSTPILPVRLGTSFPIPNEPISVDNVTRIRELGRYGLPRSLNKLSADGKLLFVASEEGVDIYDTQTNQLLNRLEVSIKYHYQMRKGGPYWYAFDKGDLGINTDGSRIVLVTEKEIQVFSREGEQLYSLPRHSENASAAISPDGTLLVVSDKDEKGKSLFQMIKVDSKESIYNWDGKNLTMHGEKPGFSPDGSYIATESGSVLWVWSTGDWSKVSTVPINHTNANMYSWVFSRDSTLIAVAHDYTVTVYQIADRSKVVCEIDDLAAIPPEPLGMAFSPDGKKIAVVESISDNLKPFSRFSPYPQDRGIGIWQITDGKRLSKKSTRGTDFIDPSLVRLRDSGEIVTYNVPGSKELGYWYSNGDATTIKTAFQFSKDETALTYRLDIRSYVCSDAACVLRFNEKSDCVWEPEWDSYEGCGSNAGIHPHSNFILGSDGQFYTLSTNYEQLHGRGFSNKIELYSGRGGGNLIAYQGPSQPDSRFEDLIALSTANKTLFYRVWNNQFNSSWTLNALDFTTGQTVGSWISWFFPHVKISQDDRYAFFVVSEMSGHRQFRKLFIFDLKNHKEMFQIKSDFIYDLAYDIFPADRVFAYARYINIKKNIDLCQSKFENPEVCVKFDYENVQGLPAPMDMSYSPDGTLLAVALSDGRIVILDTRSGKLIHEWQAWKEVSESPYGTGKVRLVFSPTGRVLATFSNTDGFVKIWGVWP